MKLKDYLNFFWETSRGGTYFEVRAFFESIIVGALFGIFVVAYQRINDPILGLLPLIPVLILVVFNPKKIFKGFSRMASTDNGFDFRFSSIVFSIIYFALILGSAAIVMQAAKYIL
jgi:hypothetical protein